MRWLYNRLNRSQYGIEFIIDDIHDVDAFRRLNTTGTEFDRDLGEIQRLYLDAIEAWRKNPLAKRIVEIYIDHVVGDGITISSPLEKFDKFIQEFWYDRRNRMPQRLASMVNEWSLSGDLFPVLFFNPDNGLSYIRFVVKPRIVGIETAENDWEQELFFSEQRVLQVTGSSGVQAGGEVIKWMGFDNPDALKPLSGSTAGRVELPPIMGHYAVNRLLGTLLGEGDLVTVLTWMLRYSRMLEDRVRLNAAVRTFLWFVTVPSKSIAPTKSKYKKPPDAGSIIVKDKDEVWEAVSPNLHANDARHDMEALRRMIYAGTFPPHWFGEKGSILAETQSMQAQAHKLLSRRQGDFVFMLEDILFTSYNRARLTRQDLPALPSTNYAELFTAQVPDLNTDDNKELAGAGQDIANAYKELVLSTEGQSRTLLTKTLEMFFKFLGEPQQDDVVQKMVDEMITSMANDNNEDAGTTEEMNKKVRSNGHVEKDKNTAL